MNYKPFMMLLVFCLLAAHASFSQRIWKEHMPGGFDTCSQCILVVLKRGPDENKKMHNINEMMEKKFIANYDGEYVFITRDELDSNTLYADKNIYRFILNSHTYGIQNPAVQVEKGAGRTGTFNSSSQALNIHLDDRQKKGESLQLANWASWKKNMEKVAEYLSKLLKKNAKQ